MPIRFVQIPSLVILAMIGLMCPPAFAADLLVGKRPNIIFILADDTGYGDLSATGNPILKTPNLDRLYAEGVRFTDFHVSPTCSPTRAALLTGRHEFKNGVTHTILERERLTLTATTLAQVMQSAGYSTGIFGKWHLGDEDAYQPNRRGFDEVFIHGCGGIGQSYAGSCGDVPGNTYYSPTILHNGTFEKTHGFCTDVFFTQATSWINSVKGQKPFFCYIPTNAAHEPVTCPPQYKEPYAGKVPDKVATFFGMIANIDENVGKLLAQLDQWGIANNTLVIFMNDNGGYAPACKIFNAGMRGSKVTPWLGGTRAVSLWRWPGKLTPHDSSALTDHIDFFPTIAELAGAKLDEKIAAQIDGRSLVPLLQDGNAAWADRLLFTHIGRWPKGANVEKYKYAGCSVHDPHWHLVCDTDGEKKWELFDLRTDYGEKRDVAADHPDVVARLDTAYDQWWAVVVPMMVNENAVGPKQNPFKEHYWKQFGGGPTTKPEAKK